MVTITLAREWVDDAGVSHSKGSDVQIDESELDEMVASGYVTISGDENENHGMRWS